MMSPQAAATVHVATDWPAFGLFFLGLTGTFGGFVAFVIRRLDSNRRSWQEFVRREVDQATAGLKQDLSQMAAVVTASSDRVIRQGEAIARIEGRLGATVLPDHQP